MKVGEMARRLGIAPRDARYVLEQGIMPEGVDETPGRGEHRELSAAQAFWLGIVLLLKQNGVRPVWASRLANMTVHIVQSTAQQFQWDPGFNPAAGMLKTENAWYADIGDLRYLRVATTAYPSGRKLLREGDWRDVVENMAVKAADPLVIVRINLSGIAARLVD